MWKENDEVENKDDINQSIPTISSQNQIINSESKTSGNKFAKFKKRDVDITGTVQSSVSNNQTVLNQVESTNSFINSKLVNSNTVIRSNTDAFQSQIVENFVPANTNNIRQEITTQSSHLNELDTTGNTG